MADQIKFALEHSVACHFCTLDISIHDMVGYCNVSKAVLFETAPYASWIQSGDNIQ